MFFRCLNWVKGEGGGAWTDITVHWSADSSTVKQTLCEHYDWVSSSDSQELLQQWDVMFALKFEHDAPGDYPQPQNLFPNSEELWTEENKIMEWWEMLWERLQKESLLNLICEW